jgi:hypothetical protein
MSSRCFGPVALKILPRIAISAVYDGLALGGSVVLFQHVSDNLDDFMCANPDTPAKVLDGIIAAPVSRMTNRLHCVAAKGTHAGSLVALAHVDGVCSVPKMEAARHLALLERANLVTWRHGKAKARSGHGFGDGFKCHRGMSKRQ